MVLPLEDHHRCNLVAKPECYDDSRAQPALSCLVQRANHLHLLSQQQTSPEAQAVPTALTAFTNCGNGAGSGGARNKSKGAVKVIDAKRANNAGIIVARIKCDYNAMARAFEEVWVQLIAMFVCTFTVVFLNFIHVSHHFVFNFIKWCYNRDEAIMTSYQMQSLIEYLPSSEEKHALKHFVEE